jgi:formate hydrogenlyase transcriptional activator
MTAAGAPLADLDVRYRALVDVASALASHAELDDLFLSLRGHIAPLLDFSFVAVSLRNGHDDSLVLRFFEPQNIEAVRLIGTTYPMDNSYPGRAVRTGRVVYVPRVEADGPYPSAILARYEVRTYCAVPLMTPRGAIGSLNFGSDRPDAYSPGDLDLMTHVAKLVAAAVENAINLDTVRRQQAALQDERDQLDLLLDVTNAVVSQLDTRALFRAVAPALRRVCGADMAALTLYDPEARVLRKHACDAGGRDAPELIPKAVEHSLDRSPSGLVFRERRPRLFTRDELLAFPDHEFFVQHDIHSACSVPLATAQDVLGTLDLAASAPDAFSPEKLGLMTRVAGQIAIAVQNAISYERIEELNAQLGREKLYLEDEIWSEHQFEDIIGRSPALRRVLREVETVAPTGSTVLITGETGSGKELVARAIHRLSARSDQAFVRLNCAAIPTGLLESELFGHEKGAFTGAISQRIGRFELAHRGTVFLDEIGEIPIELQPKLLRVLQEREFERLGSARTLRTDARLIAATNRDLATLVVEQRFREDLYYRLNVFPIQVPPLRDRREDIPMLVGHFAQQFARRMKKTIETIPADTMDALMAYEWPGNIRELQNLVERAVILSSGPTLDVPAIASMPRGRAAVPVDRPGAPAGADMPAGADSPRDGATESLEAIERRHVLAALESANWIIAGPNGAAQRLGLKRSTLQFRMRKLGISRPARAS